MGKFLGYRFIIVINADIFGGNHRGEKILEYPRLHQDWVYVSRWESYEKTSNAFYFKANWNDGQLGCRWSVKHGNIWHEVAGCSKIDPILSLQGSILSLKGPYSYLYKVVCVCCSWMTLYWYWFHCANW